MQIERFYFHASYLELILQRNKLYKNMSLVGKKVPSFNAGAVVNGEEIVENFSLNQYEGKNYVVFFFYPKDFTFVCPTELHAFQSKLQEFKSRGCEVVACSTDTEESHWSWLQLAKDKGGIEGVTYPIVADTSKTISTNFGVLAGEYEYDENGMLSASGPMIAYRGLFLIDKSGVVQHETINNFPLGRNVDETLRMLDALIHVETKGEVCPANWDKDKEAMKADPKGVAEYLSKN
jgi:peroxiredoxin (alkyl hydroperoxide reductase subunit C)